MTLRRAASLVLAAACFTGAAGAVLTTGPAARAASATAYRYWTYWYGSGASWELGRTGPPNALKDGSVVGWRFSISPDSQSDLPPRAAGDFTAICGNAAGEGKIRVAVVVDYGLAADAPSGETPPRSSPVSYCAVLSGQQGQHNGYYATQSNGHNIRVNSSGLVCGIDGYPKTECGDAVRAPVTTTSPAPSPKASVVPTKQPGGSAGPPTATQPIGPSTPTPPAATASSTPTATSPSPQVLQPSSPPSNPSATPSPSTDTTPVPSDIAAHGPSGSGHLPVGLIAGGVLVAALATAATLRARRR